MQTVSEKIDIRAPQATVWDAYVNHIDEWWTFKGKFRYTFAPPDVEPAHIRFEPELGGRFFEEFATGAVYVIGHIVVWDPPNELVYTWKDPRWDEETTIHVTFIEEADTTTVTVTHSGFASADEAEGYGEGQREILAGFAAFVSPT